MNSRYRAWPSAMSALIALATSGTTVAQTARLVADINLRQDASIGQFMDVGGWACFRVNADGLSSTLWSSDGSLGGTHRYDEEFADQASNGFAYNNLWAFDGKVYVDTFYNGGFAQVFEVDPATGHSHLFLDQQMGSPFHSERLAVVWWPFESGWSLGLVRPGTGFNVVPVQGLPNSGDISYPKYAEVDGRWLFLQGESSWGSGDYHLWRIDASTGQATDVPGMPLPLSEMFVFGGTVIGHRVRNVSYPQQYEETFVWLDPDTMASGQLTLPPEFSFGYEGLHPIQCGNRLYFNAIVYTQSNPPPRLYWFDMATHDLGFIDTSVRPDRYYPGTAVIGADLYYPASTTGVGLELRRYRPGQATPELIADINPLSDAFVGRPSYFNGPWALPLGHRLVMRADDGTSGIEPWVFDADTGVTQRLLDVLPGPQGSDPVIQGVSGDLLYFTADDGVHGRELWVTDATPEGTHLVKDIQTGTNSSDPGSFVRWRDKLVFAARPVPGQDALYSVPLGQAPATPALLPFSGSYGGMSAHVGDKTFWSIYDSNSGTRTFQVGDNSGWHEVPNGLIPGACSAGMWFNSSMVPCPAGGLFVSNGTGLWITDGSTAGTYPLASDVAPCEWVVIGSRLFFVGDQTGTGKELWVSDGTPLGTNMFTELVPGPGGSNPRGLVVDGDVLYFEAEDWQSVTRLWALNTRTNSLQATPLSIASLGLDDPRPFGVARGRVLIGESTVFWGGHPVFNWNPLTGEVRQAPPPDVQIWSYITGSPPFKRVGDRYVALGEFGELGSEPVSYDPITGETILLADTFPGRRGGVVDFRAFSRGVAFFSALEPGLGSTLWRTDGTPSGTIRVSDHAPPAFVSGYRSLVVGQHLYVNAADAEHGIELWEIDFCGADYNYDAAVTIYDLLGFLKDLESGSDDADIAGAGAEGDVPDGAVTIDDLLYFLVHFEQGC